MVRLVNMTDKQCLLLAIEQGRESMKKGGFPAGSTIVKDGKIIAEEISIGYNLNDPTAHCDIAAIRKACQALNTSNLEGATLYDALECCNMCFSVAYWAGISKIVYACRKTPEMVKKQFYEGSTSNNPINESNNRKIELVFIPDCEQESLEIVREWEKKNNL